MRTPKSTANTVVIIIMNENIKTSKIICGIVGSIATRKSKINGADDMTPFVTVK